MDFGDYPTQTKTIHWKLIILIGGGIVLAGGILIGVFAFTRKGTEPVVQKTAVTSKSTPSTPEVVTATDPCSGAADADVCLIEQTKLKAIADKKSDACESLTDVQRDDCLWSVARVAVDTSICEKMTAKDLASRCADEVTTAKAFAASDASICDKIADVQVKSACTSVASAKDSTCSTKDLDCEFTRVLAAANLASDPRLCKALDPVTEAKCRSQVLVDDPDHDGIDTTQEIVLYGTDPYNPDTDSDGYPDGAEVNSGHDPLKK